MTWNDSKFATIVSFKQVQEEMEKTYPDFVSQPVSSHFRNEKDVEWDPDVPLKKRFTGGLVVLKEELGVSFSL